MTECIITSSILIIVVISLRLLFKGKISRRLQYALWGLVLLRLLMPFSLLSSPLSVMNAVDTSQITDSISDIQVYSDMIRNTEMSPDEARTVGNGTLHEIQGYPVESGNGNLRNYIFTDSLDVVLGRIFKIIWLIGGIAAGLWFVAVNIMFYRRLRKTRKAYCAANSILPVYITGGLASPCLFGILHPAIYLTPKAVESEGSTRHVLAHELCHHHHGDHIWSILRGLCLAGWWWNPLVWTAAILSRTDSELACDEAVIKKIGEENRLAYGHTLVDMIAVGKASSDLMFAATTMVSGKRGIKERLNMIIKNPKTFVPAMAAVLLIVAVCVGCTFTGVGKGAQEQDLPAVDMTFSADNTDLGQLGRDAATFYYSQFTKDDVPQYWHITKYETLSCKLMAGDEREFAVWVTSSIETDSGGFLIGEGIPNDPDDITKGGVCPEVGRQLRIKALGDGKYETVSIGTGGGDQGLSPVEGSASYGLIQLRDGKVLQTISPLSGDEAQLAEDVIMSYLVKSVAWPGVDIKTLEEYFLLRATYYGGTTTDYYAYLLDGKAIMQQGTEGHYSRIDDELYEKLVKLAQSSISTVGGVDGSINVTTSIDRTDLDACVSDAVLTANTDQYYNCDFAAEAHTVFKTVENDSTTTVYAMALYMKFGYAGSGFFETGGSHMPVAITFEKNIAGEYELTEYWIPQDGSGYAPSIKEKFPQDIYEDALNTQKYVMSHTQSCYEQAIEYGKINVDYEITKLIEMITSSPAQMSNPQAYIEEHTNQYRELIYYGTHTLRYCFSLFEQGGQIGLKGHIMALACRDILGEEEYFHHPVTKTGQDWYDAFKAFAENQRRQNGDDYMKKNKPGSWLLLQMLEEAQE